MLKPALLSHLFQNFTCISTGTLVTNKSLFSSTPQVPHSEISHHFPNCSAFLYLATLSLFLIFKMSLKIHPGSSNLSKFGPWCIITGGTDGIGKEYATQLASSGVNLILISRSSSKLSDLSIQLCDQFGISVRTIVADFSSGVEIYSKILQGLEGLEIGSLINNVGSTYPSPCFLHELDTPSVVALLNCNILSNIMMTKLVLPGMLGGQRGIIINICSMASEVSFPFLSLYAASKAFTDKLSQDLALEYERQGIIIQTLVPACVATKMSHISEPSYFAPSPEQFVKAALNSLGSGSNRTPGTVSHQIQLWWFRALGFFVPNSFKRWNYHVMNRWRVISSVNKDTQIRKG